MKIRLSASGAGGFLLPAASARWKRALVLAAALLSPACAAEPELVRLEAAGAAIEAEVARSPEALSRGLMHRRFLCEDCGMLFLYPAPGRWCMWMKNTALDLSIAFVSAEGRILAIERMAPESETRHCAPSAALFGLEASPDWFSRRRVLPGSLLKGLPQPR